MVLPSPTHAQAAAYLRQQGVENAEALLGVSQRRTFIHADSRIGRIARRVADAAGCPAPVGHTRLRRRVDKQKQPLAVFIDWLQKWLMDVGLAQQSMAPLYYPHHAQALLQTASKTDSRKLFALLGRLNALNPYGYHTLSVKMQLEYLLIEYLDFWQNKP